MYIPPLQSFLQNIKCNYDHRYAVTEVVLRKGFEIWMMYSRSTAGVQMIACKAKGH